MWDIKITPATYNSIRDLFFIIVKIPALNCSGSFSYTIFHENGWIGQEKG